MQNDMMSAIRVVVAEEVGKTLGRQVELLERIAQYLGVPTADRASVVPAPAHATPPAPRRRRETGKASPKKRGRPRKERAAATAPESDASAAPFKQGQEVHYKQGRGRFTAVVTAVNEKAGTVTLERHGDGKQVVRPYEKVDAA
ncbi:hypothetical protein WA016_01848 [Myxococcus stipitatus]